MCPIRPNPNALLRLIAELQLTQLEEMRMSKEVLARIAAAVSEVGQSVANIAAAIKAHPAVDAEEDDQLATLAGNLETSAHTLDGIAASLGQVGVDPGAQPSGGVPVEPFPEPEPVPAEQPPVADPTGGADASGPSAEPGGEGPPAS